MTWSKKTVNGYLVATETLTYSSTSSTPEDLTSSTIDFIPPGKDFVVVANLDATNLSSDADIAIKVAAESTDTFAVLKDDLITTMDAAVKSAIYDISSYGEMPYYQIFIDADGVEAATDTVKLAIVCNC